MSRTQSDLATIATTARLIGIIAIVAALFFARDVFIPMALGLLLSFLLSPIANRFERWGLSQVLAGIVTATFAFVLLAIGFTLLGRELSTLIGELPQHKDELVTKARSVAGITSGMGGSLDQLADEVTNALEKPDEQGDSADGQASDEPEPEPEPDAGARAETGSGTEAESGSDPQPSLWQRWTDKLLPVKFDRNSVAHDGTSAKSPLYVKSVSDNVPLASWATTASTVLGPLATAGLVSVFALFMLIHRHDLRDRMIAVVSHGNYVTTTDALNEAAGRISRYLIAQTSINTGYGIILAVGLTMIGGVMAEDGAFPNAILWGVLATCLRFIPYLGPTAGAVFPSVMALSVFPGYSIFIAVVILITTMELTCNNVVEPWLYGTSTGISAVAVIVAAVFWAWLWGPVGLLLSTPLTVCLVVLGRYVPSFKIFATLLGEDMEIKASMRFYQRLLARDPHHAGEILRHYLDQNDFDAMCDDVLIPALKQIRKDHDAEYLASEDESRLIAMIGGLIAKVDPASDGEPMQSELSQSESSPSGAMQSGQVMSVADPRSICESNATTLPLVQGCVSHHFSEALLLNLLREAGQNTFALDAFDDERLPSDIGHQVAQAKPVAVVITVLPRGGIAQARYLCRSIRNAGYDGVILVACFGKFRNHDQLFVKFRKAGASHMTSTFRQTRVKIESTVRDSQRNDPDPLGHQAEA